MTLPLHADPVPLLVDDTGAIRVGHSRVTLDVLLEYWRMGMKPEEIARYESEATIDEIHKILVKNKS